MTEPKYETWDEWIGRSIAGMTREWKNHATRMGMQKAFYAKDSYIRHLEARIAELEEDVLKITDSYDGVNIYRQELEKVNKNLEAQIKRLVEVGVIRYKTITKLREALEFYALKRSYEAVVKDNKTKHLCVNRIYIDQGVIARTALQQLDSEDKPNG